VIRIDCLTAEKNTNDKKSFQRAYDPEDHRDHDPNCWPILKQNTRTSD